MGLGNWIKRKMVLLAISMAEVEKNTLGQSGGKELGSVNQERRHRQGSLADSLKQGEINQEVKDLRWRMYKVLDESQGFATKIVGYEEDGTPITETVQTSVDEQGRSSISKIKVDDHDDYPVELVVNNDAETKSVSVMFDEISDEMSSGKDSDRVISCIRELRAKFEIEKFSKKMNVRTISKIEKLLEFYVSIYPDGDNRKSNLFISEIKKAIKNPRIADFLDIIGVEFVSYNTIGVKNLHQFEYKVTGFDKIIEYDGYYVVKFKADVVKDGESLYDKFKEEDLEERYKNKEKK